MIRFDSLTWQFAVAGRWTARILGSLMVLFLLALIFGEGPPPLLRMNGREQLYSLGILCLFSGLVLAWFREGWGGLLSIAGWAFLSVLAGGPVGNAFLTIPAWIALIHLVCWWRLRGPAAPAAVPQLIIYLLAPLAVFVLLCANEIFGNPPLMTGTAAPPVALTGTWSARGSAGLVFAISPDGSVTGSVRDQPLTGRLTRNRSWFGRLMHWRTDYLIQGALSNGDRFQAPFELQEMELSGSFARRHDGEPTQVHRFRLAKRELTP